MTSILITSIVGNLLTQSLLSILLQLFFRNYLVTLLVTESLIWVVETILLCSLPQNQLQFKQAAPLTLAMNLASLALGWFLPV